MRLFAVTALEKLKNQPPEVWLKVGIAVLAVLVVVFVVRRVPVVKVAKLKQTVITLFS